MMDIFIEYKFRSNDINEIYDLVSRLKSGRDSIREKYPIVDCEVKQTDRSDSNDFCVYMNGENHLLLEKALKEYISHAGTPNFVDDISDSSVVEKVLQDFGKSLKRRSHGYLVGKQVIPSRQVD